MRIAYIISAYQYPELLARLIGRLSHEAVSFWVHVDRKTGRNVYDEMVRSVGRLPNVVFLRRHRCDWGGFGHVRATLEGIGEIVNRDVPFDYAVLLTGQDYPIKTNKFILDFFLQNNGKSYMEYFPLPSPAWDDGGLTRIEKWHFRAFHRHLVFPPAGLPFARRTLKEGLQPYGGSSYWCLTRGSVHYVYRYVQRNPGIIRFFQTVDVPDELFFQTVLLNSPSASAIVNNNLRFIEWKDQAAGSPAVLGREDFENIANSPMLFARKFDLNVDAEVLDQIDRELLHGR